MTAMGLLPIQGILGVAGGLLDFGCGHIDDLGDLVVRVLDVLLSFTSAPVGLSFGLEVLWTFALLGAALSALRTLR